MEPTLHQKLTSLSVISQKKLEGILSQCGQKKDLIIDTDLIKPFERVCGVSWLRHRGVDKIFRMDPQLITANDNRLYLIQASVTKFKSVLDQIESLLGQNEALSSKNCFHVVIIPKAFKRFENMLESQGLYGIVKLYSFSWEFISLDEGVLSLEMPYLFKTTFIEKDQSLLSSISMSLWSLFYVIGRPKISFAFGKMAGKVLDILKIYQDTYSSQTIKECNQELCALIIMDRSQDYASSLLTPATYSGLLNEIFQIKTGNLELNVKNTKLTKGKLNLHLKEKQPEEKVQTIILDSSIDSLWGEIKYRHFSEVLAVLGKKAKALKQSNVKDLGLNEIKHFVSTKLQKVTEEKKNLANHMLACETIISEMKDSFECLKSTEADMINNRNKKSNYSFVDEQFGTDIDFYYSLRLMCLLSITQSLSSDEYNNLVEKYLHAFGHKYLYVFNKLVDSGLLNPATASQLSLNIKKLGNLSDHLIRQNAFYTAASKLKQLPNEQDKMSKTCPSYVFHGGYIPLVSVLCDAVLTSENLLEALTKLSSLNDFKIGGRILEERFGQNKKGLETLVEKLSTLNLEEKELDYGSESAKKVMDVLKGSQNCGDVLPLKPKCVLVYVIGGVNYAEVAACDIVRHRTGSTILIASDSVITGSDLINAHI